MIARRVIALLLIVLPPSGANAELIDRGGGLIYDTERDITWLQNANFPQSIDLARRGKITWHAAMDWASNFRYYDPARKKTWDDWRLPSARDLDSTDICFGFDCPGSELGEMYFANGIGETNPGPFRNVEPFSYWSETSRAPLFGAWLFHFGLGKQDFTGPFEDTLLGFVWPVRDGDVGPPVATDVFPVIDITTDGISETALLRPGSVRISVLDGAAGAALSDRNYFGAVVAADLARVAVADQLGLLGAEGLGRHQHGRRGAHPAHRNPLAHAQLQQPRRVQALHTGQRPLVLGAGHRRRLEVRHVRRGHQQHLVLAGRHRARQALAESLQGREIGGRHHEGRQAQLGLQEAQDRQVQLHGVLAQMGVRLGHQARDLLQETLAQAGVDRGTAPGGSPHSPPGHRERTGGGTLWLGHSTTTRCGMRTRA